MKNLLLTLILLAAAATGQSKPYYLFTNVSRSILSSGDITAYKPDEVTWIFDTDSSMIRVLTETEDLYIRMYSCEKFISPAGIYETDVYKTEYGTIYVRFSGDGSKEFDCVSWVLSGNEYIFKMK